MPVLILIVVIGGYFLMTKQAGLSATVGNLQDRKIFIATLLPVATRIEAEYGIKVKNSLAMWAHETGYGSGKIYRNTFNLGSITAESWAVKGLDGEWSAKAGRSIFVNETVEYYSPEDERRDPKKKAGTSYVIKRPFRKYTSILEGARAWAEMLKSSDRFPERYTAATQDSLAGFAQALQQTGYATDPDYAQKIYSKYNNII